MKWVLFFLISGFLFPCGFLDSIFNTDRETKALQDVVITECTEPCWLGIEIGKTSKEQAIDILEDNDLTYTSEALGIGVEPLPSDLWDDVDEPHVVLWLEDDIVMGMLFPVRVCTSIVIDTLGTPVVVVTGDEHHYEFFYPEFGLSISASALDNYTQHLNLASKEITEANAHDTHAILWDNDFDIECY